MSAVQQLSDDWNYDPHNHDRASWWDHHRALVAAMESARWTQSRFSDSGEGHHAALFTDEEARDIREQYAAGTVSLGQISAAFDCASSTVAYLVRGDTYPLAGGPLTHRGAGKWPPNRHTA